MKGSGMCGSELPSVRLAEQGLKFIAEVGGEAGVLVPVPRLEGPGLAPRDRHAAGRLDVSLSQLDPEGESCAYGRQISFARR